MSAVPLVAAIAAELRISICLDVWAEFTGTAAQLIAEGLIPDGIEWPHKDADERWEANGFDYWLCRMRPEGHKGPMSSWLSLDHWRVRLSVTGRSYAWRTRRALERKAEQLQIEFYEQTPAGAQEQAARFNCLLEANRDRAFQAFKARVPGLVPPKRGRKPKGVAQARGHDHQEVQS